MNSSHSFLFPSACCIICITQYDICLLHLLNCFAVFAVSKLSFQFKKTPDKVENETITMVTVTVNTQLF